MSNNGAHLGFEQKLWKAADKLRSNMDAAEEEDDGVLFDEKMKELTARLKEQMEEGTNLDEGIKKNLASIGFEV